MFLSVLRFRAGFKRVFRWCPFVRVSDYDELELRAMQHKVARQSSMYTFSRIETTVVAVCDPSEPTGHPGRKSLLTHQHNGCSNPTKSKEVTYMPSDLKEEFCWDGLWRKIQTELSSTAKFKSRLFICVISLIANANIYITH